MSQSTVGLTLNSNKGSDWGQGYNGEQQGGVGYVKSQLIIAMSFARSVGKCNLVILKTYSL